MRSNLLDLKKKKSGNCLLDNRRLSASYINYSEILLNKALLITLQNHLPGMNREMFLMFCLRVCWALTVNIFFSHLNFQIC